MRVPVFVIAAMVNLQAANAALHASPRDEALLTEARPVKRPRRYGLSPEVHGLGRGSLHAEGESEGCDAGVEFAIVALGGVAAVQVLSVIQRGALIAPAREVLAEVAETADASLSRLEAGAAPAFPAAIHASVKRALKARLKNLLPVSAL